MFINETSISPRIHAEITKLLYSIGVLDPSRYLTSSSFREILILSLYRVHFKWKGKDVQLSAKSLDLTHPYFVSIKDIVFERDQQIIINPSAEDIRRTFGKSEHLMIPFQTVTLIEEFPESAENRIRPFTLIEDEKDNADTDTP